MTNEAHKIKRQVYACLKSKQYIFYKGEKGVMNYDFSNFLTKDRFENTCHSTHNSTSNAANKLSRNT